jgi:hypothetical protein
MWKTSLTWVALLLVVGFVSSAGSAGPAAPGSVAYSLPKLTDSLVLPVKHKNCHRERECLYYAPPTSCSHPPCCKTWSKYYRVCEESDKVQ